MEQQITPEDLADAFNSSGEEGVAKDSSRDDSSRNDSIKKGDDKKSGASNNPKSPLALKLLFIISLFVLIGGVAFLVAKIVIKPPIPDAEYIVDKKTWALASDENCLSADTEASDSVETDGTITGGNANAGEGAEEGGEEGGEEAKRAECQPSVVWSFSEIGKGMLTTNGHINDYDFIWALDGDKLRIETSWLYKLENEYTYRLDQEKGELTLIDGEETFIFKNLL